MLKRKAHYLAASGLFVAGALGATQTAAAQQAAPLNGVYACVDVADGAARLACFDAAVATLKARESNEGLAVISREDIRKAETEAFGLQAPSLAAIAASAAPASAATAAAAAPKELDNVRMAVTRLDKQARGRMIFVMENGQVWQQTDNIKLVNLGKGPWEAEVKRGVLGSFFLKLGNRPAVRAERVK